MTYEDVLKILGKAGRGLLISEDPRMYLFPMSVQDALDIRHFIIDQQMQVLGLTYRLEVLQEMYDELRDDIAVALERNP